MRVSFFLIAVCLTAPGAAQVYTYVDENGIQVYTNVKPDPVYDARNVGCYGTCRTGVDWHSTPLRSEVFDEEIRATAEVFGVDDALIRAVMHAESWFNPEAVSHMGAEGLMQLIPATQLRFGVQNPFDPVENITGGTAYLAWLLDEFEHNVDFAVAAYNAGENAVRRHEGIPPYSETKEYVRRVRILYDRYRNGRG